MTADNCRAFGLFTNKPTTALSRAAWLTADATAARDELIASLAAQFESHRVQLVEAVVRDAVVELERVLHNSAQHPLHSERSHHSSACEHVFFGFTTYHLPLFSGNATRETLFHQFCIPVLATFWYNFARFGMSASADGASALEVFRAFIKTPLGYSNTDAALEAASGLFRAWHALRRR